MSKSIALISFGCAKNLVDSEVMLGLLERDGNKFLTEPEAADIIILNTCGFIRPAQAEADEAIRKALRLKARNPAKKVIVAGCYVQRNRESLVRSFPQVDAWLDVAEFDKIALILKGRRPKRPDRTFLYSHLSPRIVSTPRGWAYIKVSEGCSHACTFCSIPLIKGSYRSRPPDSIVEEARALASRGVKEINLVSQDTTFYGRDLGWKDGLARLLRKLAAVRGISWIRLLYGYPEEIDDPLLEAMRDPKLCPYFDLPFQHADGRLLRLMGRSMDADRALKLIDRIRLLVPGAVIRTSLIVGFPGEGPEEYDRLERFVRRAAFDHLGVFTYSPEEGTKAFRLMGTVPEFVKARRRRRLMRLQAGISRLRNRNYRGRRVEVLLDRVSPADPRIALGRSRFQAPEVDGSVRVRASRPAFGLLGGIHRVEITSAGVYDLRGNLLE